MHLLDIPWDVFRAFSDLIVHFDLHIHHWIGEIGIWIYLVAFLIIVCETGIIIFPFLLGDSLLFALGAVAASPNNTVLSVTYLIPTLILS